MRRVLAGILLALVSAFLFATAGALQSSVTRSLAIAAAPDRGVLPVLGLLRGMLTRRVWWLGFGCNVLGFAFHATALHLGSISIVQALLCVQLMFALPFATARSRRALRLHPRSLAPLPRALLARDWAGTAAVCLGIVTLVTSRGSVEQTQDRERLVPSIVATAVLLMAALMAAARCTMRTVLVGTAAGIGFSLTAVLIVVVTGEIARSGWASLPTHWHLYALAASGLVAAVLAQDAFASGSFPAALTAMTIADPVAAWLWGAVLFDRTPPATPAALASLALAGVLICAGVTLLANSPTIATTSPT